MMDRKVFSLLGFIVFLSMTGYGIVLPTLPFLADNLHLTSFQMGTLITVWAFAQLLTAPLWGRLSDTWGRKPVLFLGLFGFAIAFFLLVFANSYWQLLFARMIGASLSSGTLPTVTAFVSDLTNLKHRSVAIAKIGSLSGLGFLCGPAVGGMFTSFGVNVPFVVAGTLAILTLPLVMIFLKEPQKKSKLHLNKLPLWKSFSLITKKKYSQLYLITFGVSLAASSFLGLLGYFMIDRFQSSPVFVSLAFSTQAGITVIVQFFFLKKLYQIFAEKSIAMYGLIFLSIGYGMIALSSQVIFVIAGCIFTGVGLACVNPTILSLLSKLSTYGQGVTMGIQQAMNSFGRVVGPLIGGFLYSLSIYSPFLVSAIITLVLFLVVYAANYGESQVN